MAFTRTQADLTWTAGGYVTTAGDLEHLGRKVFQAINAVRGGAWNPSSPIEFTSGGFQITGPLLIAYGGSILTDKVELVGADTWPMWAERHPMRSRKIAQRFLDHEPERPAMWLLHQDSMSLESVAVGVQPTDGPRMLAAGRVRFPIEVHDSSNLARVIIHFRVPEKRAEVPFRMPRARVVRADMDGTTEALASTELADANGWQSFPTVQTVDAWYAGGEAQTFTYECDQNNAVDISTYTYWLELDEEAVDPQRVPPVLLDGVAKREQKPDVDLIATDESFQPQTLADVIDGTTLTAGLRVLINRPADSPQGQFQNGIWVTKSGDWVRATDMNGLDDLTAGAFVRVKGGDRYAATTWQLARPYPTVLVDTDPYSHEGDLSFEELVPTGNRYHSFVAEFEDITHMRWQ